jgi:hypothetical protein
VAKSNLPIHLDEENHSSPMLKKWVDGQDFESTKSNFTEGVSPRKYTEENSDNDGKVRDKKIMLSAKKLLAAQNCHLEVVSVLGKKQPISVEKSNQPITLEKAKHSSQMCIKRVKGQTFDNSISKVTKISTKKQHQQSIPKRKFFLRTKKGSTSTLPFYVKVPTYRLKEVAVIDDSLNYLYFRVQPVKGDGNCLYHCLSSAHCFVENHTDYAYDASQIRTILADSTNKFPTLSQKILDTMVNEGNTRKKPISMDDWRKSIMDDKEWGSNAEMLLFSQNLNTNIVVLMQTNKGINVFGTFQYMKDLLQYRRKGDHSLVLDNGADWMDTIFIWYHRNVDPKRIIQNE